MMAGHEAGIPMRLSSGSTECQGRLRTGGASIAESLRGARFGLGCFFVPVLGRRGSFERVQQTGGNARDLVDRGIERSFVCFGWLGKAADLSHKLQRRCVDFFGCYRRVEVVKGLDASTHSLCV